MSTDWMPTTREARSAMAETWVTMITGQAQDWEIPERFVLELTEAKEKLSGMLKTPEGQRAQAFNQILKEADEALIAVMRDIKKRYFYVPPLTNDNLITLGLNIPDTEPTPIPVPLGRADGLITYLGGGQLQLDIRHMENTPLDPKADYGYKIFYDVLEADAPVPADGSFLRQNLFTRRKRRVFKFETEDFKKTAYFCIVYENPRGERGPWGPVFSAVIL